LGILKVFQKQKRKNYKNDLALTEHLGCFLAAKFFYFLHLNIARRKTGEICANLAVKPIFYPVGIRFAYL